jgi:hypothetical protein
MPPHAVPAEMPKRPHHAYLLMLDLDEIDLVRPTGQCAGDGP